MAVARVAAFGHPIAPLAERHQPFFIIGSGRSGTTLTRAILQSHPVISIPPETYVLGACIKEYLRYRRLPWNVLVRMIMARFDYQRGDNGAHDIGIRLGDLYEPLARAPAAQRNGAFLLHSIYMHYARVEKPGATRWGDKTPTNTFHLGRIRRVFPDACFIHLIRDGRDVVSSYLRMRRYTTLDEAASRWVRSVTFAQEFGRRWPKQYREVRYEDLVRESGKTIHSLCSFLGLEPHAAMLDHTQVTEGLSDIERHSHLQNVRRPIFDSSVGQWATRLSASQVRQLDVLLEPFLGELGYR